MSPHLITRATILGTGLIGGSFALALRKYATDLHISGWDRPEIVREARSRNIIDEAFATDLAPALRAADLIYIALPIGVTIDLLPERARHRFSRLPRSIHIAARSRPARLRLPQAPRENRCPPALARRAAARLRRRHGLPSSATRRRSPRFIPLRSSRRKRSPHHRSRPRPARFLAFSRQP